MNYTIQNDEEGKPLSKKQQFTKDFDYALNINRLAYFVIVILLPSGEKELIINSNDFEGKFQYVISTYDEDLFMYTNRSIRILDWVIT